MPEVERVEIERYLQSISGPSARLGSMKRLGEDSESTIKGYGYGQPILIAYKTDNGPRRAVLHTVTPNPFGHEDMSDRAQSLLWEHRSFNGLPRHVRSLDVGAFRANGTLVSLGDAEEFFLLTEYIEGHLYAEDLSRLRDGSELLRADLARADQLADYLAGIHRVGGGDPGLYVRRVRELIGHSECIMGLIDTYPRHEHVDRALLQQIELQCVGWRWRLKDRVHRLRQVHGDFHPWNILFQEGVEFGLLDRSRGEWGEPADDVSCLTMNFLFFSLQRSGRLDGNFETLFRRFWDRYLAKSSDTEMLQVVAPYFAFRGLVMAHPLWYPDLSRDVRGKLFKFIDAVLKENVFDPKEVNHYCGA